MQAPVMQVPTHHSGGVVFISSGWKPRGQIAFGPVRPGGALY